MDMGFIKETIVIKTANYRSVFSCFLVPEFFLLPSEQNARDIPACKGWINASCFLDQWLIEKDRPTWSWLQTHCTLSPPVFAAHSINYWMFCFDIWGSHSGFPEDASLLACDSLSLREWLAKSHGVASSSLQSPYFRSFKIVTEYYAFLLLLLLLGLISKRVSAIVLNLGNTIPILALIFFFLRLQNFIKRLLASSCLSVRPHGTRGSNVTDFREIWYLSAFTKSVEKNQVLLKSAESNRNFTWRPIFIFDHILLISSQNEKCFRQKL